MEKKGQGIMMIAHAPAGYLLSRWMFSRACLPERGRWLFMTAGIAGALAPDMDLLWFHFVDNGSVHHHAYFTHYPLLWVAVFLAGMIYLMVRRERRNSMLVIVFAANAFLHMILDSVVGDIRWMEPFSEAAFSLFMVTDRYDPWWLNFIVHPSFLLEVGIAAVAIHIMRVPPGRSAAC